MSISHSISLVMITMAVTSSTFAPTGDAAEPSFAEATRDPYQQPPEKSINGKSIAQMKQEIQKLWGEIELQSNGQPVPLVATLQTDAGDIEIKFYEKDAPGHVRNFIALSKVGFYDGLIFHRCIPGFVIQGGCPNGDGTGGPGYCVKAEFNNRKHTRGVLSMARAQPEDSAGCQFFICVAQAAALDGKYTAFGEVTKGMDVVDKIVKAPRGFNDRPDKPIKIKSVQVTTKETP